MSSLHDDASRVVGQYTSRRGHRVSIVIRGDKTYKERLQSLANSCASANNVATEERNAQQEKVAA